MQIFNIDYICSSQEMLLKKLDGITRSEMLLKK